jgi:hypothetical protein
MKESFILKLIIFLLAVWLLSSCVGSPITVQVANDVQGDVVQEAGKVETYSETNYVPPAANDRLIPTVMMLATGMLVIGGLLFIMYSGSKREKLSKEEYYNE